MEITLISFMKEQQVKDVENAYIVRDDTEYASGQFLPLWSFGLLY